VEDLPCGDWFLQEKYYKITRKFLQKPPAETAAPSRWGLVS